MIRINSDSTGIQGSPRIILEMVFHLIGPQRVFLDPNAISLFDESHSGLDEERWTTLGMDRTGTLLVINHTFRDESPTSARIRIISARKASKKEVEDYKGKK